MKCIIFVTMVILYLFNCTYSKKPPREHIFTGPVIISERVGDTIDVEEREYFRLFEPEYLSPDDAYEFRSATIWSIDVGGYKLIISIADDTIAVVNRDPQGIEILKDYIDNYEEIQESTGIFEEKWGIVDHDFIGIPITNHEIVLTRKHMIATKKPAQARLDPIMKGALIGMSAGGAVACIVALTYGSNFDLNDPGIEGAFACIETGGFALAAFGLVAGGALAGGCIGSIVDMAGQELGEPEIDEKAALNYIKKSRLPKMKDDTQQERIWQGH